MADGASCSSGTCETPCDPPEATNDEVGQTSVTISTCACSAVRGSEAEAAITFEDTSATTSHWRIESAEPDTIRIVGEGHILENVPNDVPLTIELTSRDLARFVLRLTKTVAGIAGVSVACE